MSKQLATALLDSHLAAFQLPAPVRELVFAKALKRRWRFDYAWPEAMIAAEVDGATWANGRHTRGSGYQKDCEKLNTAALLGWRVFRFTDGMVRSGEAVRVIAQVLHQTDRQSA